MLIDLWLVISILMLFFMIAGIALFYSGSVRYFNSLSTLCMTLVLIPFIYFFWIFLGFDLIFSANIFDFNTQINLVHPLGINNHLYSLYQFLFAYISILVLWGASLERVQIKFMVIFSIGWFLTVYIPVARLILNDNGWLHQLGAVDFAGGYTVHITSGFSALVLARSIGRRLDYFSLINKFNQTSIFIGTFFIWIGWFGFNAGSTLVFNQQSNIAILNTFVTSVSSLFVWYLIDYLHTPNRITMIGLSAGLISGLVAITPGAGLITTGQAFFLGLITGLICNYSSKLLHKVFKTDDVTEIFSSHGIGGLIGAIFTGYCVDKFFENLLASFVVFTFSVVVSYLLFKVCNLFIRARVTEKEESEGLDIKYFGEQIINR